MANRNEALLQVRTHLSGGRADAAALVCAKLLSANPTDLEARYLQGRCKAALGRWSAAAADFRRVLAVLPQYYPALIDIGMAQALAGEYRDARRALELARSRDPGPAELHFGLGLCALGTGELAVAEESFRAALARNPGLTDAYNNLGVVLDRQGRLDEALAYFRQVVLMQPDYVLAHKNLADALLRNGEASAAVASYQQVIERAPQDAAAHADLGMALLSAGEFAAALIPLERALELDPQLFDAAANLGEALRNLGELDRAAQAFERALSIRPDTAEAHLGLGRIDAQRDRAAQAEASLLAAARLRPSDARMISTIARALEDLGRQDRALDLLQGASDLAPTDGDLQEARGDLLQRFGRWREAADAYERALAFEPNRLQTLLGLGRVLESQGSHRQAIANIRRFLVMQPQSADGYAALASCAFRVCDWNLVEESLERLRALPSGVDALHPFLVLASSLDPPAQSQALRRRGQALEPTARAAPAPRYDHERLRLAYVSPDFREHPVAHALAGVIERHDRKRFAPIAIALTAADASPIGQRLRASFEEFIDASALSTSAVARLIREREIDVAIDLGGHTVGARPAIFSSRPASVQVNYLGFPGSMGTNFMDFIIADPTVLPGADEPLYAERVLRLPNCYLPFDCGRADEERPIRRADIGLPEDGFVFCAYNNGYKITRPVFEVWMSLLREVPRSVLWLRSAGAETNGNLQAAAAAQGISAERLIFAPFVQSKEEYVARLRCADLFLDTVPYNAHTTASEVLWAGVPLVSCLGRTFAGRVGASLLRAVGLDELICNDLAEYRERALGIARSPAELCTLRERLSRNRRAMPLFDTERYTRDLEAVLSEAWQIGPAPQGGA